MVEVEPVAPVVGFETELTECYRKRFQAQVLVSLFR